MVDWLNQVNGEDVMINTPYIDFFRGGMIVRSASKSVDGNTTVEYVRPDGTLGKYLSMTTYLRFGLDPVEALIYYNLFSDYHKIDYKKKFAGAFMGDFDLGDIVEIPNPNRIGMVFGLSLDSTDRKSKVLVQYISQLGELEIEYVEKPYIRPVGGYEDRLAIFHESMHTFGYEYDESRKMIVKYGDRFPAYHQDGWDIETNVEKRDNPSAHGVIIKKDGRYAYVKFIGRKTAEKVPMTNLSFLQTSNSRTTDKLDEIFKESDRKGEVWRK
jgi:hypothetical protein